MPRCGPQSLDMAPRHPHPVSSKRAPNYPSRYGQRTRLPSRVPQTRLRPCRTVSQNRACIPLVPGSANGPNGSAPVQCEQKQVSDQEPADHSLPSVQGPLLLPYAHLRARRAIDRQMVQPPANGSTTTAGSLWRMHRSWHPMPFSALLPKGFRYRPMHRASAPAPQPVAPHLHTASLSPGSKLLALPTGARPAPAVRLANCCRDAYQLSKDWCRSAK